MKTFLGECVCAGFACASLMAHNAAAEPPAAPALVDLALMPMYTVQNLRTSVCNDCLSNDNALNLKSLAAPGFRLSLGYRAPRRERGEKDEPKYTKDIVLAAYVDYVFALGKVNRTETPTSASDLLSRVSLGALLQMGIWDTEKWGDFALQPRVFGTVISVQTPNGNESFSGIGGGLDAIWTFYRAEWHLAQVVLGADAALPFAERDISGSSSVTARAFSALAGLRFALGTDLASAR